MTEEKDSFQIKKEPDQYIDSIKAATPDTLQQVE